MHSNERKEDVQNISEVHGSKFKQKALKKKTCTCLQFFQTHTKRHFLKVNHYNKVKCIKSTNKAKLLL